MIGDVLPKPIFLNLVASILETFLRMSPFIDDVILFNGIIHPVPKLIVHPSYYLGV